MFVILGEYFGAAEPAVAANVLLYLGETERTRRHLKRLIEAIEGSDIRLEYYQRELMLYFHVARLFEAGIGALGRLKERIRDFIVARQDGSGCINNGFDTAASALSLMYLGLWNCDALEGAVQYLAQDEMHKNGWQPIHYCNPPAVEFQDGCAELTAVLYADALHRYRNYIATEPHNAATRYALHRATHFLHACKQIRLTAR